MKTTNKTTCIHNINSILNSRHGSGLPRKNAHDEGNQGMAREWEHTRSYLGLGSLCPSKVIPQEERFGRHLRDS